MMVGVKEGVGVWVMVGVNVAVGVEVLVGVEVGVGVAVGVKVLVGVGVGVARNASWLLQAGRHIQNRSKIPSSLSFISLIVSDHCTGGHPDHGHGSGHFFAYPASIQVDQAAHQDPERG